MPALKVYRILYYMIVQSAIPRLVLKAEEFDLFEFLLVDILQNLLDFNLFTSVNVGDDHPLLLE